MALQRKEDGLPRAGSRLAPSATAHCSPLRRKCRGLRPPVSRSAWFTVRLLPGARTLRSGPRNDRVADDGAGGSRLAPSATAHCSPLRRKCRGFRPPVFRSAWLAVHLLPGARTLRVTDPPLRVRDGIPRATSPGKRATHRTKGTARPARRAALSLPVQRPSSSRGPALPKTVNQL